MEYIAGKTDFKLKNSAVTLGKFDGIHQGHQLLLDRVLSYKELGYTSAMFTFLYHPGNLFSDQEFKLIYTEEEKIHKVQRAGLDVLISYPFTLETKNIEPEAFIKEILVDRLDAKIIVVGNDFRFGRERRGDVALLQSLENTYGYQVIPCEKKKWKDNIISSTLIRKELEEGNMEAVNALLGHTYSILGEVRHGRKLGRTLGMPTINLLPPNGKLLPPCGVYASKTIVDGITYPGITNIGYKPTVGEDEIKSVETYIFDFDRDLYGKEIELELYSYERPEIKFNSLEELRLQMLKDIEFGRKFFIA